MARTFLLVVAGLVVGVVWWAAIGWVGSVTLAMRIMPDWTWGGFVDGRLAEAIRLAHARLWAFPALGAAGAALMMLALTAGREEMANRLGAWVGLTGLAVWGFFFVTLNERLAPWRWEVWVVFAVVIGVGTAIVAAGRWLFRNWRWPWWLRGLGLGYLAGAFVGMAGLCVVVIGTGLFWEPLDWRTLTWAGWLEWWRRADARFVPELLGGWLIVCMVIGMVLGVRAEYRGRQRVVAVGEAQDGPLARWRRRKSA